MLELQYSKSGKKFSFWWKNMENRRKKEFCSIDFIAKVIHYKWGQIDYKNFRVFFFTFARNLPNNQPTLNYLQYMVCDIFLKKQPVTEKTKT
jgi:hypothetical protein